MLGGAIVSLGIWSLLGNGAMARTFEFKVRPLLTSSSNASPCPDRVIAYETPKPYQEGGYSTDGMVNLSAIATNISLSKSDPFSATWVGTLKEGFKNCRAAAGIANVDSAPYPHHSYMRLQFLEGKVYFILDMTGLQDANGYTTQILEKTMRAANPRWNWGGTD
jgi:hypothetical protein